MYSRNISGRNNDDQYRANIPPKYSGSRFAQTPPDNRSSTTPAQPPRTGRTPYQGENPPSDRVSGVRQDIPVKMTPDMGMTDLEFPDEILAEDEVISLPDFEFVPDFRRQNTGSPVIETYDYQAIDEPEDVQDEISSNSDLYEQVSAHTDSLGEKESEEQERHEAKEENENAKETSSKGGFLSGLFGGDKNRKGDKSGFSYEDLLLAGLILLISSSGTKDNEDILIILALLLAYRD